MIAILLGFNSDKILVFNKQKFLSLLMKYLILGFNIKISLKKFQRQLIKSLNLPSNSILQFFKELNTKL
jgi:hypothetical protein